MKPQIHIKALLGAVIAGMLLSSPVQSQCSIAANLVPNGAFESGNTDFTSAYGYNPGNLVPEGKYDVVTNPRADHGSFAACGDKTTGTGKMMVINGAPTAGVNVWCSTISTTTNSDYIFSTYVTSVHATSPAVLQFSINGVALGANFNASGTTCTWNQFCQTWNSGASTSANICIVNQNTAATGNDFALDDIKMGIVAPLYVDLNSFFVKKDKTSAELKWASATELDHDYYSIERSADAQNWENIAVIEGKGNSSGMTFYQYKDTEPLAGKNYYRLKMVDKSGLADYSVTKFIQMEENYTMYKIYPNPTYNKVTLVGAEKIDEVLLVNSLGMVVYQKKLDHMQKDVAMDFSNINQGIYWVKLLANDVLMHSETLVKK
ncbi:MAG: T9SS type A sorting domain-containing protein [Flavobacteriales bacterium]